MMRVAFTRREAQQVLRQMITGTSGRHREILDELCRAFPNPRTDKQLMKSLNIASPVTLKAMIHNANSINPVKISYLPCGGKSYVFCDKAPKRQLIMRELVTAWKG
ncbi:hypothetical protein ACPV5L_01735 [Vibrio astriarenae]|jgi:hypothetical protein